ncbi:enolase superfamily member [Anaeramoeba ignava]|uniref:Enolase superfamily member n=1 Tax=Anaeramoeba ignava TaxID=1746090 RepID=A0A9Q0R4G1_ANAIG|nr:enolase superfamily member [Anaeramoeba ignava]
MKKTFIIKDSKIEISCKVFPLNLRTTFGTSHSFSNKRENILITISNGNETGFGEVGLPPKKPPIYVADPDDVMEWMKSLFSLLDFLLSDSLETENVDLRKQLDSYDLYSNIPQQKPKDVNVPYPIHVLFFALDYCPANLESYANPAKSGFEMAIWDLFGKLTKQTARKLLGIEGNEGLGFYTIAMTDNKEETKNTIKFGRKYTNNLKIKVNLDFEWIKFVFSEILEQEKEDNSSVKDGDDSAKKLGQLCVDANGSWDTGFVERFVSFVNVTCPKRVVMVEQPFPPVFPSDQNINEKWKNAKIISHSAGILFYADESFSDQNQIQTLAPFIDGVIIKLEKTGGLRNAVSVITQAKQAGLKIWIGMMVGSILLSNASAVLLPLAEKADVDGALLVDDQSQPFKGGFEWNPQTGIISLSQSYGLGIETKDN